MSDAQNSKKPPRLPEEANPPTEAGGGGDGVLLRTDDLEHHRLKDIEIYGLLLELARPATL